MGVDWLRDVLLPLLVTVFGTTIAVGTTAVVAGLVKAAKTELKAARTQSSRRRRSAWWLTVQQALRRQWVKIVVAVAIVTVVAVVILAVTLSATPAAQVIDEPDSPAITATDLALAGWGPERNTVSMLSRNSQVTLNSMIDNPAHGDERNFAQVKEQDAPNSDYTDHMVVEPGDVYTVFFYFSNDAAESETEFVAENTRLSVRAPGVFTGAASIYGVVSASNAEPEEVWDGVTFVLGSDTDAAALRYVQGSATIHVNGAADGTKLDAIDLFSPDGAELGCDALDGRLPSVARCAGYVVFDLRVDQPGFVVTAGARPKGSDEPYLDHVDARVGDVIQVRVEYQNTGTTQQDNVSIRALLPEGFRYVEESTVIANSTTEGVYEPTIDGIASTGMNVGSYQPGGNVFVRFDVMVDELAAAGGARLLSLPELVRVTTSGGYKSAPMTFIVLG